MNAKEIIRQARRNAGMDHDYQLSKATGIPNTTLRLHLKNPGSMRCSELCQIVKHTGMDDEMIAAFIRAILGGEE